VLSTFARKAAGASSARHSLRPLIKRAEGFGQNPDASRRGNAKVHPDVIACDKREAFAQGSESDEAIHSCCLMDCFANARNDDLNESWLFEI
jgi:hypothetical protein